MSCGEACFISSARISRSISFSRSPGGDIKPPAEANDHTSFGLSFGIFQFIEILFWDPGIPRKLVLRNMEGLSNVNKSGSKQALLYVSHLFLLSGMGVPVYQSN